MNYIAMYVNYRKGIPSLEEDCINQNIAMALSKPNVCDVILVTDKGHQHKYLADGVHIIDADDFNFYVNKKLIENGLEPTLTTWIKPNHYADYLAYYSAQIAKDFLGDDRAQVLKLDTDFFVTSKFALRNVFECDRDTFIGVDEGFIYKYVNGDANCLPNYFYNAHAVYCTGDSSIMDIKTFVKYLTESITMNHYTATGPRVLNDLYKYPKDEMHLPGLTPWTLDPSTININRDKVFMELPVRSAALGIHLQSSVLKTIGMKRGNIRYPRYLANTIQIILMGVQHGTSR